MIAQAECSRRRSPQLIYSSPDASSTRSLKLHYGDGNGGDLRRAGVENTEEAYFVCQSVALVRPTVVEMAAYLEIWLNSQAHGGAHHRTWAYGEGRPHLSFDQLRATAIATPSLPEQAE